VTIVFLSHFDGNLYLFRLPIMKALASKGWRVIALAPEGDYSHRFTKEGIEYIAYNIERASLNPLSALRTIRSISRVLRSIRPDILHTFTVKPNIFGLIAGTLAGVNVRIASVTGLGSFFIETGLKAALVRFMITSFYRLLFPFATAVIFQNSDDKELFIKKRLVTTKKCRLIKGSGIDTDLWKRQRPLPERPEVILFIGRLLIHKGIREYIRAAEHLKILYPNLRFLVAGDYDRGNPYNLPEEEMIRAVEKGWVEPLGWREDIRELLDGADLFILPSYREGLPRTALEAASMGLPVITTDTVGCKEAVDEGETGFLVELGGADGIIEAVVLLLEHPERYHAMAEASRRKAVAEFDVRAIVAQHLELYNRCLE